MNHPLSIVTYEGNVVYYPVTIRRYNSKVPENLTAASAVLVEWEDGAGVEQPQINVLSTLPGADWANGLIIIPIDQTNFTAAIGKYTFSLTILIGGQTITHTTGTVEVRERPGFPSA